MTPNEYQQLALRTESPAQAHLTPSMSRIVHAMAGCTSESGELWDAMKKHMFYGKDLDHVNLVEEFGDLLWYVAQGLDALGCTMEQCMQKNIAKLKARYGEKFSNVAALNRNLDLERETLEEIGKDLGI